MSYFVALALATSSPQSQSGDAFASACVSSPQPRESLEESDTLSSQTGDMTSCIAESPPSQQSVEMSMIIPTLPYRVTSGPGTEQSGTSMESSSGPDVIDNLTVKVSCRKDKTERNFILPEVAIHDISTLKDLKFYLTHKLPIGEIGSVGYVVRGRKKVWFHTDSELQKLIKSTLIKGKGALWCDGVMQSTCNDDDVNPDEESASNISPAAKKTKVTAMDERRERVQRLFEELKAKHGSAFSGPQYRLWAEAVASGSHASTEEPPFGSMFNRQTTSKAQRRDHHCSYSATAIAAVSVSSSPPRDTQAQAQGTNLTPKSAASLRSTYIKQIKELHGLLDLEAITETQFKSQKEKIFMMMDSL